MNFLKNYSPVMLLALLSVLMFCGCRSDDTTSADTSTQLLSPSGMENTQKDEAGQVAADSIFYGYVKGKEDRARSVSIGYDYLDPFRGDFSWYKRVVMETVESCQSNASQEAEITEIILTISDNFAREHGGTRPWCYTINVGLKKTGRDCKCPSRERVMDENERMYVWARQDLMWRNWLSSWAGQYVRGGEAYQRALKQCYQDGKRYAMVRIFDALVPGFELIETAKEARRQNRMYPNFEAT